MYKVIIITRRRRREQLFMNAGGRAARNTRVLYRRV